MGRSQTIRHTLWRTLSSEILPAINVKLADFNVTIQVDQQMPELVQCPLLQRQITEFHSEIVDFGRSSSKCRLHSFPIYKSTLVHRLTTCPLFAESNFYSPKITRFIISTCPLTENIPADWLTGCDVTQRTVLPHSECKSRHGTEGIAPYEDPANTGVDFGFEVL